MHIAAPVAIDEPQRIFYDSQFGITFPAFVHYGVEPWGPTIEPDSNAHDPVMALYGGVSKVKASASGFASARQQTPSARWRDGIPEGGRPTVAASATPTRTRTPARPLRASAWIGSSASDNSDSRGRPGVVACAETIAVET